MLKKKLKLLKITELKSQETNIRDTLVGDEEFKGKKVEADTYADEKKENERRLRGKMEEDANKNVTPFQPE